MPAQIVIFLDSVGNFHAEMPGRNGARRKIDLPLDFAQRNPELVAELVAEHEVERQRKLADLRAMQNENIQYIADNHGVGMARKVYHNGQLVFSRAVARMMDTTGVITRELSKNSKPKSSGKSRANSGPAITINMDEI